MHPIIGLGVITLITYFIAGDYTTLARFVDDTGRLRELAASGADRRRTLDRLFAGVSTYLDSDHLAGFGVEHCGCSPLDPGTVEDLIIARGAAYAFVG